MTIKDDNGDPVLNIDSSKFVITVTGGTLQGTGVFGSISENSNGQYEFVVNNTGGRTGDAVFTIVVDGVTIGTVTHTITAS